MIHGPPGAGKSTLALQSAPGAPWLSSEMDPAALRAYARRLDVAPPLGVLVIRDQLRAASWLRGAPVVVLDSVPPSWEDFGELDRWRLDCGVDVVVAIAQEAKDRTARGSLRLPHQADVVIRVADGQVKVVKNRTGPTFEERLNGH